MFARPAIMPSVVLILNADILSFEIQLHESFPCTLRQGEEHLLSQLEWQRGPDGRINALKVQLKRQWTRRNGCEVLAPELCW